MIWGCGKIILVLCALPIIGFFVFALLFYVSMSLGYLNFMMFYWELKEAVALAKDYPMAVDTDIGIEKRNVNLHPKTVARATIRKDKNHGLHAWFDKGCGNLGNQGYMYAEVLAQSFRENGSLPRSESYKYNHLIGNWRYDGIYD